MHYQPIVDYNPGRAKFIVALPDGTHAVFTLHSYAVIKVGMGVQGPLEHRGRHSLMPDSRQIFKAYGETGPTTLEECKQRLWGPAA